MPIASAQVKSCLLLASLYAQVKPPFYLQFLRAIILNVCWKLFVMRSLFQVIKFELGGQGKLHPTYIEVPSDISSAAFFMIAATIAPNSQIVLKNIGINPYRIGIINILRLMGAHITFENEGVVGQEYVADIRVRSAILHGIDIPLDQVPFAIDEFPVIFIAAACAHGVTVLRGAQELHVKETDRIHVMAEGLQQIGISVEERPDGMSIEGGKIKGGVVDSYGDHRVAMSFAIAGAVAKHETVIKNCENVATSFPNFVELRDWWVLIFSRL